MLLYYSYSNIVMKQDSGNNKHSNISDNDSCLFFNVFINILGKIWNSILERKSMSFVDGPVM